MSPTDQQKKSSFVSPNILVIDDEAGFRALLSLELTKRGYRVTTAVNGEDALEKTRQDKFDLAISDIKMPKLDGIEFLDAIKKESPGVEVIMATGFGTIETAVSAMKKGAYDFVQKPYNLPEVLALVEKALEKSELKAILGVYEASKAIFTSIKLETLLPIIMDITLKIIRADDASIMLLDEKGHLSLASSTGVENEDRQKARLALAERVAGKAVGTKNPIILSGPLENDSRFSDIPNLRGIQSSVFYPLLIDGQFLGVLNVNRIVRKDPFSNSDLCGITIFGSQIAQAVFNSNIYRQLELKVQELKKAYGQLENTQLQLIQSEKLAAIGELAAGVAHELNNPLTGILGFAEIILKCNDLPGQIKEDIEAIYQQSIRCRDIIQNLLQFSRRKTLKKEAICLIPLMESTLQLLKYDFNTSGIIIKKEFDESIPSVSGDPSQLQQVFLNFITNAKHAMENKKPAELTIKIFKDSEKVLISFTDTGCGIPKEIRGKIFDPFFTTKPVGKGTGLGLSISYGIVQQHDGTIEMDSEVGLGTTFILSLPQYSSSKNE